MSIFDNVAYDRGIHGIRRRKKLITVIQYLQYVGHGMKSGTGSLICKPVINRAARGYVLQRSGDRANIFFG
jgi:hypothetical protein